ncbi:hypothetical protein Cyrtocomes_01144 [Candidatus Cyrtobacter comes]|uniref:Uncharacterized protein n=1 Tax=Candidatus Cyrtobacter comes TaxID=675776 RepID=A0ABU5L9F7_9RICK|nr:hypothetical protein [Candidatus Cyrtobacter comes]MDZ5762750.1 hypothetical protein [Candidatus Cyrtobacter comes]
MKNYKDGTNIGASQQEEIKNSGLLDSHAEGVLNANLQNESQTLDVRLHEILSEYKFDNIHVAQYLEKIVRWMMKEQSFWNNKDKIEQLIMKMLSYALQDIDNVWIIRLTYSMERYPDFWTKEANVEQFINILDKLQDADLNRITYLIKDMAEYPNFWTKEANVEQFINISNKLQCSHIFGFPNLIHYMKKYPDFWSNETKIEELAKVYNNALCKLPRRLFPNDLIESVIQNEDFWFNEENVKLISSLHEGLKYSPFSDAKELVQFIAEHRVFLDQYTAQIKSIFQVVSSPRLKELTSFVVSNTDFINDHVRFGTVISVAQELDIPNVSDFQELVEYVMTKEGDFFDDIISIAQELDIFNVSNFQKLVEYVMTKKRDFFNDHRASVDLVINMIKAKALTFDTGDFITLIDHMVEKQVVFDYHQASIDLATSILIALNYTGIVGSVRSKAFYMSQAKEFISIMADNTEFITDQHNAELLLSITQALKHINSSCIEDIIKSIKRYSEFFEDVDNIAQLAKVYNALGDAHSLFNIGPIVESMVQDEDFWFNEGNVRLISSLHEGLERSPFFNPQELMQFIVENNELLGQYTQQVRDILQVLRNINAYDNGHSVEELNSFVGSNKGFFNDQKSFEATIRMAKQLRSPKISDLTELIDFVIEKKGFCHNEECVKSVTSITEKLKWSLTISELKELTNYMINRGKFFENQQNIASVITILKGIYYKYNIYYGYDVYTYTISNLKELVDYMMDHKAFFEDQENVRSMIVLITNKTLAVATRNISDLKKLVGYIMDHKVFFDNQENIKQITGPLWHTFTEKSSFIEDRKNYIEMVEQNPKINIQDLMPFIHYMSSHEHKDDGDYIIEHGRLSMMYDQVYYLDDKVGHHIQDIKYWALIHRTIKITRDGKVASLGDMDSMLGHWYKFPFYQSKKMMWVTSGFEGLGICKNLNYRGDKLYTVMNAYNKYSLFELLGYEELIRIRSTFKPINIEVYKERKLYDFVKNFSQKAINSLYSGLQSADDEAYIHNVGKVSAHYSLHNDGTHYIRIELHDKKAKLQDFTSLKEDIVSCIEQEIGTVNKGCI